MNLDFIRFPFERCVRMSDEEWQAVVHKGRGHKKPAQPKRPADERKVAYWRELLTMNNGSIEGAAQDAGISANYARKIIARLGLVAADYRPLNRLIRELTGSAQCRSPR